MEEVIYEDSPLAEYLQGAGRAEVQWEEADCSDNPSRDGSATGLVGRNADYAPRGPPQRAVKARPSEAENARFLEHFRYILVASQLLDESTNQAAWRTAPPSARPATPSPLEFKAVPTSGAIVAGVTALALIWLVHWSRVGPKAQNISKPRAAVVMVAVAIVAAAFYVYARRQLMLYLRHQAIASSTDLVAGLQSFDAVSSSAIQLVQEVELVSRGYRLSVPLPPITRLDQSSSARRCIRLRKSLRTAFATTLPALADACQSMQSSMDEDDLERYLDVYDVNNEDVQQAAVGYREDEFEDLEGLRAIRIHQYRFVTFRRLFLCSLLAVDADGSGADFARWRTAGESMQKLAAAISEASAKISRILSEEESFNITSPTSPGGASHSQGSMSSPPQARQRLREQFRKLATLSTGIRSLQAKMQILREDSQLALASPSGHSTTTITFLDGRTDNIDAATEDDMQLAEMGNGLLAHYDAIGSDLKSLVQAWESGRAGLSMSLERAERRIVRTSGVSSSSLRSPNVSLGGLTAVEEVLGGTPDDALKALEGDSSAPYRSPASPRGRSPPCGLRMSSSTDDVSDAADSGLGMDEVFEAVALPKTRALGTPQERAARIAAGRRRTSTIRERREASKQMIRELESVITCGGTPGERRASHLDRQQSSSLSRGDGCEAASRHSVSPAPSSPAPSGVGSVDRQSSSSSSSSSNATAQNGVMGRRRPFSIYNIGTGAKNRVTSV